MSDSIVKPSELTAARKWVEESFLRPASGADWTRFPVSFRYGEEASSSVLPGWTARREPARTGGHAAADEDAAAVSGRRSPVEVPGVTRETVVFSDPHTGLECRCEITAYADFPAVEWVVYFKNTGAADTPILSDIQPLDVLLPIAAQASCQVHHARGSLAQANDFEPLATPLTFRQGGSPLQLAARTGKCSTLNLPFFNLELGTGGVIGAIGWTGGWAASFQRQRDGVRVRAGMERTHLTLRPGEEIRTPRILLLFWEGAATGGDASPGAAVSAERMAERIRSHNMLRRLILAHYTPRSHNTPGGSGHDQLLQPPFCESAWGARPTESHLAKIRWLQENRIPAECYWIDAGWYGDRPIVEAADGLSSAWMTQVGSWTPNSAAYPAGMRPIGEAAQAAGLGFLLWIEPERAHQGSEMTRSHPEWLIGPVPSGYRTTNNYMVNLGIPAARRYITDLVSNLITEGRITCYRQDFNDLRVPELFAMADAADRIGMAEIRHITGLYAFWDELLARHPGLIIDNCAGGGQRIDLETIRRSVPLTRSDLPCWPFDPLAMQAETQGLAPWVPLSAAICAEPTQYAMRSALGPGLVTSWSSQALEGGAALPLDQIRQWMAEAHAMRKYFYGDFYPLLSFSLAADAWAAWQYDRPDLGEGIVVAFRRHASPFPCWQAKLHALDPEAEYELHSWDDHSSRRTSGKDLMTTGFDVTIAEKPGSALFSYKRL